MSEYLNPPELHTLTGYARCTDQGKWLASKGIPHRLDGKRVIVSREHVKSRLRAITQAEKRRNDPERLARIAESERYQLESHRLAKEADDRWRVGIEQRVILAKRAYSSRRRANKTGNCPAWANLDAIKMVYEQAQELTKATGIQHHVDHIIPLLGKTVSGLHVHEKLQVIPALDNLRKHNRYEVS